MNIAVVVSIFVSSICTGLRAEVCNTPGCLQIANFLNKSMDLTVDPCEDFYNFVCGNYIKGLDITESHFDGVYFGLYYEVNNLAKAVLEGNYSGEDPEWLKKAKNYYHNCMDTARLDKYAVLAMKKQLRKFGGWPVLDAGWDEVHFDWIEVEKKLYKTGQPTSQLMSISVSWSDDDLISNIIEIDSRYHDIAIDKFLGGMDGLQTYLEALVDIAVVFGAERQRAEQDMQEVLQFEIALANLTDQKENPTKAPVPTKISELQEAWPYISWLEMLQFYFGDKDQRNNITEDEPVKVDAPFYLENLGDLLSKTPKRVLANYLMSRVVFANGDILNQEVRNLTLAAIYEEPFPTRSTICYNKATQNMLVAVAAGYVREYVTVKEKQEATEMTELLRQELIKVIASTDWISNSTKDRGINKVRHIRLRIAYPEELVNDTFLNDFYKDLKICPWSQLKNDQKLRIWNNHYKQQQLRQKVWKNWDYQLDRVLDPNPSFQQDGNFLSAYAAALEGLQYSADRPVHVNLATLGTALGHELTHSVDSNGRYYNEMGQLEDWWDSVSEEEYKKLAQELADEYSTYEVKGANMTLNGSLEILEIIADEGGYKIARNAMDNASGKDQNLPGLEQYSAEKIFWITLSIFYCSKIDPQVLRLLIKADPHPTDEWRVKGPFLNSPQFALDWSCPVGSFMNPKNKFNVW